MGELGGHGIAYGVGNVDGGGAGFDGGLDDLGEELGFGAGCVFWGKFDVVDEGFGEGDAFAGEAKDFFAGFFEFELSVDCGGGEEDVDAGAGASGFEGGGGGFDVAGQAAGEAGDDGAVDLGGDFVDGLEIAVANDGETGFDDVHIDACELSGDFEFFAKVHAGAGALFAVAEGGVEDDDLIRHRLWEGW